MVMVHSPHDADGTENTGSSRANFLPSDLCRGQMMPDYNYLFICNFFFCSTGTTAGIPIPPHPTHLLHPGVVGWWGDSPGHHSGQHSSKGGGAGGSGGGGGSGWGGGSYLSRLCSGMEPEPEPSIPFFPLNNFSTRATLPVRAASSSSCSFPIPDTTSLQRRRGDGGPAADDNPRDVP